MLPPNPCAICLTDTPGLPAGCVCDFCVEAELEAEPEALPAPQDERYYVESDFLYDCYRERGRF